MTEEDPAAFGGQPAPGAVPAPAMPPSPPLTWLHPLGAPGSRRLQPRLLRLLMLPQLRHAGYDQPPSGRWREHTGKSLFLGEEKQQGHPRWVVVEQVEDRRTPRWQSCGARWESVREGEWGAGIIWEEHREERSVKTSVDSER